MREIPREPHDRGRVELREIGHDLAQMCVVTLLKLVLNQIFPSDLRVPRPALDANSDERHALPFSGGTTNSAFPSLAISTSWFIGADRCWRLADNGETPVGIVFRELMDLPQHF